MNIAKVKDSDLRNAASAGMDEFLKVFTDAIMASVAESLQPTQWQNSIQIR